ncbi:MAG: DNA recombination protein RmuC [Opitutales bacterium]|nr:DNA recombination protein RmuC [Opitutales bacterium]
MSLSVAVCFLLSVLCAALAVWLAAELRGKFKARASLKEARESLAQAEILLGKERVLREIAEKTSAQAASKNSELSEENLRLKTDAARMEERENALVEKARDFEALSAKIFDDARKKFEFSNKAHLDAVLAPLKENLASFRKRIDDVAEKDERKYGSLESQINKLSEMNASLSKEANNLATALISNNKAAGNWGEMVLSRVLEGCGLTENVDFLTQDTHSQDGKPRVLDVLVRLPGGRGFIIDSKVSLVNYMNYCAAADAKIREAELKLFLNSVRAHVKTLSSKKYEELKDVKNPDFVLIFIPIEGAFELAVTRDADLLQFANSKKIALASPATLLACMRTVENVWSVEKQNKSTAEIAELGKMLHERICLFLERFAELGKSIDRVRDEYSKIDASLASGKGVVRTAQRLEDLGAKSKSLIDKKYLEDGGDGQGQ